MVPHVTEFTENGVHARYKTQYLFSPNGKAGTLLPASTVLRKGSKILPDESKTKEDMIKRLVPGLRHLYMAPLSFAQLTPPNFQNNNKRQFLNRPIAGVIVLGKPSTPTKCQMSG